MFKLFERQPNWALKQLVQETDQPAVCFFFCFAFILVPYWTLERPAPPPQKNNKSWFILASPLAYIHISAYIHRSALN